jgi:hypothetical protein
MDFPPPAQFAVFALKTWGVDNAGPGSGGGTFLVMIGAEELP